MTNDEHEISQIFAWIEDQNEILEFISDILDVATLEDSIKDVLVNSLLSIAYLPEVISSLVLINPSQKKRTLNTCIFILIQTFKIFRATA